ncbi:MAG: hypothetical protein KJ666_14925 [Bacteroidetes bacterium]|nr:hypothetical protein [Bacteroidota bacterium]
MKNMFLIISLLFFLVLNFESYAQRGDPTLHKIGYHTGNRTGISFYNDGQIAGFNIGRDIRGEWPLGSGENYIGDLIPLIGIEFINKRGDTLHSVTISRGPRVDQSNEKHPTFGYFWGFNPIPGFLNPTYESVAMSHLPKSWPIEGWRDQPTWKDKEGRTQWNGYFGRGIMNADQESYYKADDQMDDEFNGFFNPDSTDLTRKGMGLLMSVRGFQWSSFLAEDAIFWLYDIKNEGATTYRKAAFGTVVGTLAGGDGDSGDDLGFFDVRDWITYSWDSDNRGNKGQKVGYVGYAFLESPGNPFDGIDNDGDSPDPTSPKFVKSDFDSVTYRAGDQIVLIDPFTYERKLYTVKSTIDTVYSLGVPFIINPGVTYFREGHIAQIVNGVAVPHRSALDGIDNDLDGLIDENESVHLTARQINKLDGLKYKNFKTGAGVNDPLIDEKRDNDAGSPKTSWIRLPDGRVIQMTHWSGDEDGDWDPLVDDVGSDGVGKHDDGYLGPDPDGTEGNGRPDQGETNFGKTDVDESDQIGLTNFNFFNQAASPSMKDDELLWSRMFPGRFDVIPSQPQDGDFIYGSGYFPLPPQKIERFSISILFGEDYKDILGNKRIVQQIYNAGYKFPQPPKKPKITITQDDGNVAIYWDGRPTENSKDLITKLRDFQGYKIYRATDAGFQDARSITNAVGVFSFDKPIVQFDLVDSIQGFFYPSSALLTQLGGTTFYMGSNTGLVNKWVDSSVVKGQTYFYAVCAYDRGDERLDIFPTENSKFIFKTSTGQILIDDNTGYITPGGRPIGYTEASYSSFTKSAVFIGTGTGEAEIIDDASIKNGFNYKIVFSDTALQGYTKDWSLIDLQTPDTVYIPKTKTTLIVKPGESIAIPKGDTIYINGVRFLADTSIFTAAFDTLVQHETKFNGQTPIAHGFRIQLYNDDEIKLDTIKTKFTGKTHPSLQKPVFAPFFWTASGPGAAYNGIRMPYDYQFEFSNTVIDTSIADTLYPATPGNILPARPVNFKIKNLTTGKYIDFVYFRTGTVSTVHNIYFKEEIGSKIYRTWRVNIFYNVANIVLSDTTAGTKFEIFTKKLFSRKDEFYFTTKGAAININTAKSELDRIKVVPNPYVVTHQAEARLLSTQTSGRGEREIRFTYVPPGSKISIFTVRGELINTLHQDNLFVGDVFWNLRTNENMDVAFGVYVYVIEAPQIGTKTGKLALIK